MTKYRYDQLLFSSVTSNYINVGTYTSTVSCSGTYANGGGANFNGAVALPKALNLPQLYLINQNTNNKSLITDTSASIDDIWQYVSSETVQIAINFTVNQATVQISVSNNTGATITLINQTYTIEVVEYQLPF